MKKLKTRRSVLRVEAGGTSQIEDVVVTEQPVTLKINGKEQATLLCTPDYIEELAIGYVLSEGMIRRYEEIQHLRVEDSGFVHLEVGQVNPLFEKLQHKRYVTSCCGGSRRGFVFAADMFTVKKKPGVSIQVTPAQCIERMKELQHAASLFHETGGVHNAALCDAHQVLLTRSDIGRHNALDKIYGHCLKNDWDMTGKMLAFSGRISSEILLKAAKIGCEIVLSKSAPTELAIEAAQEIGITMVGFIRDGAMNVYTGSERILLPES